MTDQFKIYQQQFDDIVEKIDNQLNFNEIYEAETGYKFDKKRQSTCIFCGSGSGIHKNSDGAFTYYPTSNTAKCYSCGTATGINKLIMHTHNCDYKTSIHYIAKEYLHTEIIDPKQDIQISEFKPKTKIEISERKKISEAERLVEEQEKQRIFEWIKFEILKIKDKKIAGEYLASRGIDLEKLPGDSYHQAAPYKNLPAGVVFLDSTGNLLNKRYISKELPQGVAKMFNQGHLINSVYDFTFRADSDTLYITEGVINSLSLFSCEKSAIALFASTNYINDIQKFKTYFHEKNIIIAFDADKGGQQSAIKQADFIFNNFTIKSLSMLIFPDGIDANDLLQNKVPAYPALLEYIDSTYNYAHLDDYTIKYHLKRIKLDQKEYYPKLKDSNYYTRPAATEEQDGTFKLDKTEIIPDDIIKMFRGTNLLENETFKKYMISYLNEYTVFEKKTAHVHKSIEGLPIFYIDLSSKQSGIFWRPFHKKPYTEFEFRNKDKKDITLFGESEAFNAFESISMGDSELDFQKGKPLKLERIIIAYNMIDFLNLAAVDEVPVYNFNDKLSYDEMETLQGYADDIYQIPTNDPRTLEIARRNGLKFIDLHTMLVPKLNGVELHSIKQFLENHQEPRVFKKQLNTALPFKFWDFEKGDYDINIIKLRNFLQANGYYTYPALQERQGYMYIKINGRIVNRMDKDTFPRYIETFIDGYLRHRGESVKLRNKITISSRFSESNLSGLEEIQLDFQNSDKHFQNWFFKDGTMWTVTINGIQKHSQNSLSKYVWDDELLNYPSEKHGTPFKIFFQKSYLNELEELRKMDKSDELYFHKKVQISGMKPTEKYDIEITDRNNYFLQFLFLTSHVHYEKVEQKGIEIKPTDFWYNLTDILSNDEIMEIKLHLINKLTWLGYMMKDYKGMSDDYGLAILDAIDNEDGIKKKGAAGGGKSIITKAIKEVKRTLVLKAETEDWCEDKHRYENYNGEKIIVADDMHLKSRIGNMLTDFSEGIEVNPKHKRPRKIPFVNSPKIIVTRNYIDDEGERVDRRLGRMFVFPFFHDNKGGRHKIQRRPSDYFKRMLFQDDTPEQKAQLINLFAYCYIANLKYGEINPPMMDMEKFRLIKRIGEPLIEFLDIFFEDPANFGFIDRVPLFNEFKEKMRNTMSSYQRTNIYGTSQKFKNLVEYYCQLRNYDFNPESEINDPKRKRIMKQSETQVNKHGHAISTEHFCIRPKEENFPDGEELPTYENVTIHSNSSQNAHQQAFDFNNNSEDLPF